MHDRLVLRALRHDLRAARDHEDRALLALDLGAGLDRERGARLDEQLLEARDHVDVVGFKVVFVRDVVVEPDHLAAVRRLGSGAASATGVVGVSSPHAASTGDEQAREQDQGTGHGEELLVRDAHSKLELDATDDGHADLVGEDLDVVLGADDALVEEVAAGELQPQVARQRLAHGEVEPVERLLVDVARAAGADLLDPAAERVVEQIDARPGPPRLVAEPEVRDVGRLALQRARRAAAEVDLRAGSGSGCRRSRAPRAPASRGRARRAPRARRRSWSRPRAFAKLMFWPSPARPRPCARSDRGSASRTRWRRAPRCRRGTSPSGGRRCGPGSRSRSGLPPIARRRT